MALSKGTTVGVYLLSGEFFYAIILRVKAAADGAHYLHTAIKEYCTECVVGTQNLIDCLNNCPCSQWEYVTVCP